MSLPSAEVSNPLAEVRNPIVLSRAEWLKVVLIYAGIVVATGLGIYATFRIGSQYTIFWPLGILAYTLGLRHGVDADHICAIDNTTRKLIQQDKRPTTVGTWFSLGHSTIVVAMIAVLVVSYQFITSNLPTFEAYGAVLGALISGAFLYIIALINFLIFWQIYLIFRSLRSGALDQNKLDETLLKRGFMNRYFGKLFKFVNEPWQIYPIGVLFGLGFDTASEVALIVITVATATSSVVHIPLWMVMVLPFMFTCGMVLTDTTDGFGMRFAYGWAFMRPIRKIYYNLTMTVISVIVALVIGTIELLGVLASELSLSGGPFGFWNTMNWLNNANGPDGIEIWGWCGIVIILLFVASWGVSIAIYRWKRIEEVGFVRPPSPPDAERIEPVASTEST